jgi:hypothetical protein
MGLFIHAATKNLGKSAILGVFPFTSNIPSRIIDIVQTRSGERKLKKMFWMVSTGEIKGDLWRLKE